MLSATTDGAPTLRRRPFYQKSENFCPPDPAAVAEHRLFHDKTTHGTDGPVSVTYCKEFSPSHRLWHDTLNNVNVQTNEAHLSGSNVGAWTTVVAVDPASMTRSYAAPAYYLPITHRKNLLVLTNADVSELILEKTDSEWTAKGIHFKHKSETFTATASHEIIVCAGSVASPQLLELSGIGNPSVLQKAGIEIKVPNPNVGENLQDHISEHIRPEHTRHFTNDRE